MIVLFFLQFFSRCLSDSIRGCVPWSVCLSECLNVRLERENFDDAKSTEKRISDHRSSCLASIQPPPTHILPLPTHITAPAHQQRLRIGRVSGLVSFGDATPEEALSVRWSVRWSVDRSVGRSITLELKTQKTRIYDAAVVILCV